jgi:hypothetical protein
VKKDVFQNVSLEHSSEEQNTLLILGHVPFFGFIVSGRYKILPHMKDIMKLHLFCMIVVVLLYITGFYSLANILLLVYIVWSLIQALKLHFQNEMNILSISHFPTPEELYILSSSLIQYFSHTLHDKKVFIPLKEIVESKTKKRNLQIQKETEYLQTLHESKIP